MHSQHRGKGFGFGTAVTLCRKRLQSQSWPLTSRGRRLAKVQVRLFEGTGLENGNTGLEQSWQSDASWHLRVRNVVPRAVGCP